MGGGAAAERRSARGSMPVFLALQCYSCAAFQVVQEKKSSNKFACALCHEKQSVRKVRCRPAAGMPSDRRAQD